MENTELRYCNVNTIVPEVRSAIERIIEMIKAELPDSLVTSAELNEKPNPPAMLGRME